MDRIDFDTKESFHILRQNKDFLEGFFEDTYGCLHRAWTMHSRENLKLEDFSEIDWYGVPKRIFIGNKEYCVTNAIEQVGAERIKAAMNPEVAKIMKDFFDPQEGQDWEFINVYLQHAFDDILID